MIRRVSIIGGILLLIPLASSAHGGIQKIVEGTYLLNFSGSPIAPEAGKQQQGLLSVSDLQNSLVKRDAVFDIEVRKDHQVIERRQNVAATGGLLNIRFTYPEPGFYEVAAKFHFAGDAHWYEPEDFEVQAVEAAAPDRAAPPAAPGAIPWMAGVAGIVVAFAAGIVVAFAAGWMFGRKKHSR